MKKSNLMFIITSSYVMTTITRHWIDVLKLEVVIGARINIGGIRLLIRSEQP